MKIKEWIIRKLGGVPNYTLSYVHGGIGSRVYSCPVTTLEVQTIVDEEVYDKDFMLSNLSKSLAKAIVDSKLYSYEEWKEGSIAPHLIKGVMRVHVSK